MKKLIFFILFFGGLLLVSACQQTAPVEEEAAATPASIVKGGAIYDQWWAAVDGASEPTENQALWATQSTNTRSGKDTWRCKECHGWDYQGIDGAYSSGSHSTGFTGVYNAGMSKSKGELESIMRGGGNADHDFSSLLGEEGVTDIVNFLSEGLIDASEYISYSTKGITVWADLVNGKVRYDRSCATCHAGDGRIAEFDEEYLTNLANDNPWEVLHKIRFGQPDGAMPGSVHSGWSTQDAVDVLAYTQSLHYRGVGGDIK